jgi:hypothetical protein
MNTELVTAARAFARRYEGHASLARDLEGWSCRVKLLASDAREAVTLTVDDGRVTGITGDAPGTTGGEGEAELTVTAERAILLDILALRLNPNQPYVFGELTVSGDEADFLRVDYIASTLCAP